MPERDIYHPRSGPRLPATAPDGGIRLRAAQHESEALGEYCNTCGRHRRVNVFELRLRGKHAGWYQLCDACYDRRNPPPNQSDADSLEVA